jgi:hypothetical protein
VGLTTTRWVKSAFNSMDVSIIDIVLPILTVLQKTLWRSPGWLNIDKKKSFGRRAIDSYPKHQPYPTPDHAA